MARGFDSKGVEEQQSLASAEKSRTPNPNLTPEQQATQRERANLELARTKLLNDLALSTNERHRTMLEMALKEVERKLSK